MTFLSILKSREEGIYCTLSNLETANQEKVGEGGLYLEAEKQLSCCIFGSPKGLPSFFEFVNWSKAKLVWGRSTESLI